MAAKLQSSHYIQNRKKAMMVPLPIEGNISSRPDKILTERERIESTKLIRQRMFCQTVTSLG